MIQYICQSCGTAFDFPEKRVEQELIDGRLRVDAWGVCPVCFCEFYDPADLCRCGRPKLEEETLCRECRQDLLRRFTAFADSLTAEEEEQLDDWLDGDTITNRKKWR